MSDERAAIRIASRLCPRCGAAAAAGVQLCDSCRASENARAASAMAQLRADRRRRKRCAACRRRSRRFLCWLCAWRRKVRETLGGAALRNTISSGDTSSPIVHNGEQTEGAAQRGGAPTRASSAQVQREADPSGGAA